MPHLADSTAIEKGSEIEINVFQGQKPWAITIFPKEPTSYETEAVIPPQMDVTANIMKLGTM